MKNILVAFICLLAISNSFASDDVDKKLVDEYIKASRMEQLINATVESSIPVDAASVSPEQRAQLKQLINKAIGWDAIKDQFAEIVGSTFTTKELKAYLAFKKTPVGNSISMKEVDLSLKISALLAKNMGKIGLEMAKSMDLSFTPETQSEGELVASNVEEHSTDGKDYFTGVVENHGKKGHRGVQVEVDLFMAGKFVDQYSTYISGTVVPGAQRYFKISCGCKDSPPAQHDSYKVQLIEGY